MKAILIREPGSNKQLYIGEVEKPTPAPNQILVKVKATALNRADILQRQGKYPPPKGASPILGLEMSGIIEDLGSKCKKWKKGDKVIALLSGGGYAEYVTVPEDMAMPIPKNLSFEEAAAIPEAFLTAYKALFWLGNLQKGYSVLIHAGASGVGTAAIQLVKYSGSRAIITAGSKTKLDFCKNLGAEITLNYKDGEFAEKVIIGTKGAGVNIIIDFIGAPYLEQNIKCLARDGKIIILATMGGKIVKEFDICSLFKKRAQLITSALRSRSHDYKAQLTKEFSENFLNAFEQGKIKPVVDKKFNWQQVAKAHQYMEDNKNSGKIVMNGM